MEGQINFEYWRDVTRKIACSYGIRSREDIEDLEQIAILKIIGVQECEGDKDAYYARICRNLVIQHLRRQRDELSIETVGELHSANPEVAIIDSIEARTRLSELDEDDQSLIVQTALGYSTSEQAGSELNTDPLAIHIRSRLRTLRRHAKSVSDK